MAAVPKLPTFIKAWNGIILVLATVSSRASNINTLTTAFANHGIYFLHSGELVYTG
jgi:hypothetical protein